MLALALVLFVASLVVAAEIGLRAYQRIAFGVPLGAWIPSPAPHQFPLSPFLVFGPRVDWTVPNRGDGAHTRFNAQGFRTPDPVGPKRDGELRIVTLGGSTTEDLWNDAGIHWPLVMECRLRQAGRTDVRVLNAGMSAYTTAHSLVRLAFDIVAYEPDVITVMHNVNDLTVSYWATTQGRPVDPNYLVRFGQKEFTGIRGEADVVVSRVWRALSSRLDPEPPPPELTGPVDLAPGLAAYERNLESLVAVARAHGTRIVLLTMPEAPSDSLYAYTRAGYRSGQPTVGPLPVEHARFSADFARFNAALDSVGARLDVPVVRMHERMDRRAENFADVVHLTSAGTRAFGESIAEALLPLLPAPHDVPVPQAPGDPSCDWDGGAP